MLQEYVPDEGPCDATALLVWFGQRLVGRTKTFQETIQIGNVQLEYNILIDNPITLIIS